MAETTVGGQNIIVALYRLHQSVKACGAENHALSHHVTSFSLFYHTITKKKAPKGLNVY